MGRLIKSRRRDEKQVMANEVTSSRKNADAAKSILKLKLEHLIVLEALENASSSYKRVVNTAEIASALSPSDRKRLEETYSNSLGDILAKILTLLCARNLVFSMLAANKRRFYGSVKSLSPNDVQAPTIQSRRRRVLDLVQETVTTLQRAVRIADVIEHAATITAANHIPSIEITRDVLSLEQTGELRIVGRVRGDGRGINLYLPSELDPTHYMPTEPLTWLEQVVKVFNQLWAEHISESATEGVNPRPVSTSEVRVRLKASLGKCPTLDDPMIVVNAMQQLARTENPVLRKVMRGNQGAVLWVPIGVRDEDLNLVNVYISDLSRTTEAIRRAVTRLGRPVNSKDIKLEFERDSSLQPIGSQRTFELLSEASRRNRLSKVKERGSYTGRGVFRVGRIGGTAYYCIDDMRAANLYIQVRQLELQWIDSGAGQELSAAESCTLLSVAVGRVLRLVCEAKNILQEIDAILGNENCEGETLRIANHLRKQVDECRLNSLSWLSSHSSEAETLPTDVSMEVPGLTGKDLLPILTPLYPYAVNTKSPVKLAMYLARAIRRVPNPDHLNRFSDNYTNAVELMFDRADALLYIAKQWGGHECCLQAMIAKSVLGLLRDPRFVFPALSSPSFEARLAGVACLAFLGSDEGNRLVKEVAINDPDFGVRQSAIWAYGFAGGEDAIELISNRAETDTHPHVRSFAKQMLEFSDSGWWAL